MLNRKKKKDKKKSYKVNKLSVSKVEEALRNWEVSTPMPTNALKSLEDKNERDLVDQKE